jgi:prepilin-type N-terminal cleavage/methylation domain-containing protein
VPSPKPIKHLFQKRSTALKHASFLRADAGFSITELAVVVAILSILSAIAIPSFLQSKNEATVAAVKGLNLITPNPGPEQVMVFTPYTIHGGGYNFNKDTTRVSLEMRFWNTND